MKIDLTIFVILLLVAPAFAQQTYPVQQPSASRQQDLEPIVRDMAKNQPDFVAYLIKNPQHLTQSIPDKQLREEFRRQYLTERYQSGCASGNCGSAQRQQMYPVARQSNRQPAPAMDTSGWKPARTVLGSRPMLGAAQNCANGQCDPSMSPPSYPPSIPPSYPPIVPQPTVQVGRNGKDGRDGMDGLPGRDAEVDYGRIEAMLAAAIAKIPKGDKGDEGKSWRPAKEDIDNIVDIAIARMPQPIDKPITLRVHFLDRNGDMAFEQVVQFVDLEGPTGLKTEGIVRIPPHKFNIYDDVNGDGVMSEAETFRLSEPLGKPLKWEVTGGIKASGVPPIKDNTIKDNVK